MLICRPGTVSLQPRNLKLQKFWRKAEIDKDNIYLKVFSMCTLELKRLTVLCQSYTTALPVESIKTD